MSNKNKIVYSNIQPNPKESKVWLHPHDGLKTYNQQKQEWGGTTGGSSNDDSKKELLTFTFDGSIEQQCEKGMNWVEWQLSEYNTCSAIPQGLMNVPEFLIEDAVFLYPDKPSRVYLIHDPDKGSDNSGWSIFEKYGDEIKPKNYWIVRPG